MTTVQPIAAVVDWQNPKTLARDRRTLWQGVDQLPDNNSVPGLCRQPFPHGNLEYGLEHASMTVDLGPNNRRLSSEWSHLRLVADARIDNRAELWDLLKGAPYLADTLTADFSDELAILAAYARWGQRATEHLIGDYAFVIHDDRRQRIFAACDGMNMRTLYYRRRRHGLCLASDAAQLLQLPDVTSTLNQQALGLWVYGHPDPALSMYADIERLRPGHSLTASADGVRVRKFWDLEPGRRVRHRSIDGYAEELQALLQRAVQDRLRPATSAAATQMSGGMDSTTITALANRSRAPDEQPLTVLSHRYTEGTAQDESTTIDTVAAHLGLRDHRSVDVNTHLHLPYGELYPPHADSPGTVLSPRYHDDLRLTRDAGASVLLTGSGGDEMCWGHSLSYAQRLKRGDFTALTEVVRGSREHGLPLRQTLRGLFVTPLLPQRLVARLRHRGSSPGPAWIDNATRQRLGLQEHIDHFSVQPDKNTDPVFAARYNALRWSSTIHSVRSHAMVGRAYGVEVSHPFFDRRVAEFSFAIPDDLWLREGQPKWLLRRAMQDKLPDSLLGSKQKVVFDGFFHELLKSRSDEVRRTLAHEALYDLKLANRDMLLSQFENAMAKRAPFSVELLFALQLQSWMASTNCQA